MNDNVAIFSFIGMAFSASCAAIGLSIIMRAAYRAVAAIWERRDQIDAEVEQDFRMRVR